MAEDTVSILAEVHERLSQIMLEGDLNTPPEALMEVHPAAIVMGQASIEQRAMAILYGEVVREHDRLHAAENLPKGINPRVSFAHYRYHVVGPMLMELLIWSAHRAFPDVAEQISIVSMRIDADWNLYAVPRNPGRLSL